MLVLGLTGGIACGKSTVSAHLRDRYNIPIIDADVIAREVVEPGTRAYKKIVAYFGQYVPDLVREDGSLNRAALGKAVFGKPEELKKLNSFIHPEVRRLILWRMFVNWVKGTRLVVLDVPLLFEAGMDKLCGFTVTVVCDDDTQIKRLLERDESLNAEDAKKRIASQMSTESKIQKSDFVLDNSTTLQDLYDQISQLVNSTRPSLWKTALYMIPPFGLFAALWSIVFHSKRTPQHRQFPLISST